MSEQTAARLVAHPEPGKVWVQIPHRDDIGSDWIAVDELPPTQPPAAKCDYCDQRATTLAGDTNGVLVCEDHVRLFAEREIAAAIDAAQPPAAPENEADANGLTEAEWAALTRCDCGHDIGGEHNSYGCYGGGPACGCNETDDRPGVNFAAVERIVAERVRVVEGERDAVAEKAEWWERTCTYWHEQATEAQRFRDMNAARAESAEAAHRALQAAVEALADEWAEDYPGPTAACNRTPDEWARDLRALLAGGAR
jgi:hypothetical protein